MQSEIHTATLNPVFAGHAARQIQDAVGGIQRVLDNLLEIANGKDPDANTYDRLRATRVLYDRGFGKVAKNQPQSPAPESKSEKSNNPTNHSSDIAAKSNRPVAKLEEKLDDALGPPQTPIRLYEPGRAPTAPGYAPYPDAGVIPSLTNVTQILSFGWTSNPNPSDVTYPAGVASVQFTMPIGSTKSSRKGRRHALGRQDRNHHRFSGRHGRRGGPPVRARGGQRRRL